VRKLTPVELAPWTLPLIAVAISLPVIALFAIAGPAAGMAAGALVAAAIVVIAARSRFDEEIEVAPAPAGGGGVLVVVSAPIEGAAAIEAVARASRQAGADPDADRPAVLVLAPALNSRLSHWLSDLRTARLEAQERLAVSLAVLAAAGVDARGQVGDTDPVQATEDALRSFSAREVIFVTAGRRGTAAAATVRRRLDRPVRHVISDEAVAGEWSREAARP
jgi:hypothetical protein